MTEREIRAIQGLEIRTEGGKPPRLVGYAAVFNSKSQDLGGFVEIIRPGAFARTLAAKADVRALLNHDPNHVLGRNVAGTLDVTEDERGLHSDILPPDTQTGRDTLESVRRGDLDGMSFAFRAVKDRWTFDENPKVPAFRELLDVDLFDVSVVTYPAYLRTDIAIRSLDVTQAVQTYLHTDVALRAMEAARAAWADPARKLETARRRVRLADLERQPPA